MESQSRLLELDADLASAVEDPVRRGEAIQSVTAAVTTLETGEALDVQSLAELAPLGVLLVDGFLLRELVTSGRVSADLLGPDDLVRPADVEHHASPLRCTSQWSAITTVKLALLDGDFLRLSRPWPEIAAVLVERAGRPGRRLVSSHAIATLPSVDMRLLATLWEWVSRWGFVSSSGVRLDLPLSHSRIGHLIGARRPTVTAALGRLRREGFVEQLEGGAWLLRPPAREPAGMGGEGLQMPMLEQMRRSPRTRMRVGEATATAGRGPVSVGADGQRAHGAGVLHRRLAEQRELLQLASARHEEMLVRLQRESSQLRANSATLSRLARRSGSGAEV